MKGIKKEKKYIYIKLGNQLSHTHPVYVIEKENPESSFSCPVYAHAPAGELRRAQ
jgi:hypothetical protein